MPTRGHSSAPKFTEDKPRELSRYFAELETLFASCNVTGDEQKKLHACRYVAIEIAELWEALPQYTTSSTYDQWKLEIMKLYPGTSSTDRWTEADLDKIVGERSRLGIKTLEDLADYYRPFYMVSTFLITQARLSANEQSRAFIRGIPRYLWERMQTRLMVAHPGHLANEGYTLENLYKAAVYVITVDSPNSHSSYTPAQEPNPVISPYSVPGTYAPPITTQPGLKMEDLSTMFEKLAQTILVAINAKSNDHTSHDHRPANHGNCNFCGEPGHFMGQCPKLTSYVALGKCRRNVDGKVVLPSGAFLSKAIIGKWLADRFDEYHRQNPGQLAIGQLSANTTTSTMLYGCIPSQPQEDNAVEIETLRLSAESRIEALERELFSLRAKPVFDGVEVPRIRRGPPAREQPVIIPQTASQPPQSSQNGSETAPQSTETINDPPIHPFANIPEAQYIPPSKRNFGAQAEKEKPSKEPAYRTIAPIHSSHFAEEVYTRSMKLPFVTLSSEELLSISPEYRQKMRDAVTPKRIYPTEIEKVSDAVATHIQEEALPQVASEVPRTSHGRNGIPTPAEAFIVADVYETYLNNLQPGEEPKRLTVAKDSHALRSLMMLVDHQEHIEAIIDPGSQIIAMSETVCFNLGLHFDPTIQLNMQSANGEIDRSLGLARNVPCNVGDITLYFQIHVIRNPAYDILLGRPFDVLTESLIKNYKNEDQTITICDPNSGKVNTIPTIPRGKPRHNIKRTPPENFQVVSRN